jgi:hypothetical protein
MRTPEQVRWDFVQQWLEKAHKDLRAAAILLRDDVRDYENAGFHIEFPKTHSIALLRQLVAQADRALAERLAPADALTPYGVEFRYPGDLVSLTHGQGVEAHQLAEQARDLIAAHLQPYLEAGRPPDMEPAQG